MKNNKSNTLKLVGEIISHAPTPIIITDNQMVVLKANNSFLSMINKFEDDIIGNNISDIFHNQDFLSYISDIKNNNEYRGVFSLKGQEMNIHISKKTHTDFIILYITYSQINRDNIARFISADFISAVVEQSPAVIELYDLNGTQVYVNKSYEKLWGFEASHTVGVFNLFESEEVKSSGLLQYINSAYQGNTVIVPDYAYDSRGATEGRGKGRKRWLSTTISPIKDAQQMVTNIMISHIDITERVDTWEKNQNLYHQLKVNEERLRLAMEATIDGLWDWDFKNDVLYWSPRAWQMLGYENEAFVLNFDTWKSLIHPDDLQNVLDVLMLKMNSENSQFSIEFRYKMADGNWKWVQGRGKIVTKNDIGKIIRVIGTHVDITERKKFEFEILEREKLLQTVIEAIPIPVFYKDTQGHYLGFNKAFETFFGKTKEELFGKNVFDLAPLDLASIYHAKDMEVFENNDIQIFESQVKSTNGIIKDVIFHKAAFYDSFNRKIGLIGGILDITELKRQQRQITESETLFRTTLYSIGDAVITTNKEGFIVKMNPVAEKLTGWTEIESEGVKIDKIFRIINEETREIVDSPVDKVIREGMIVIVGLANHTLLISKTGNEIPIADSGAPIKDDLGNIIGVVLVFRNQSEERLKEKILTSRIKLYEFSTYNDLQQVMIKTLDEVCDITKSPIGFYHFLLEDEQTISMQAWSTKTAERFCKAEGHGSHYNLTQAGVWADCVRERKPVIHNNYASLTYKKGMPEGHAPVNRELVVPVFRKDKIVAILGVGNKTENYVEKDIEVVTHLADILWEIAEKKRLDENLHESVRKLNATIDNVRGIVYRCKNDKLWTMEYINEGVEVVTGYQASAFIGNVQLSWSDIIHPDDREMVWNVVQNSLSLNTHYNIEFRIFDSKNKIRWMWEKGCGVYQKDELVALEGIINDITDRKELELQLIEARNRAEESDRLKSAFLSNMSHEIRTPMNGILGFIELLKESELTQSQRDSYFEVIKKSGDRLLTTINDIIEISKIEAGQMPMNTHSFRLKDVIMDLFHFFKPQVEVKGIDFTLNYDCEDDLFIESDQGKLESIITNLIKNAIKFTNQGRINLCVKSYEKELYFEVKDTGIGIEKEKSFFVFDRFIQADNAISRKYEGAGLGLSICKAYALMLGGNIAVKSDLGVGSVFSFTIEKKRVVVKKNIEQKLKEMFGQNQKNIKILIVEDDDTSFILLQAILMKENYDVLRAENGEIGVKMVDDDTEISLILMDIKMPIMDGYEATRLIRKKNKTIPIIAQSAYALEGDKEKTILAGCNDFISKPVKREDLLSKINYFLSHFKN